MILPPPKPFQTRSIKLNLLSTARFLNPCLSWKSERWSVRHSKFGMQCKQKSVSLMRDTGYSSVQESFRKMLTCLMCQVLHVLQRRRTTRWFRVRRSQRIRSQIDRCSQQCRVCLNLELAYQIARSKESKMRKYSNSTGIELRVSTRKAKVHQIQPSNCPVKKTWLVNIRLCPKVQTSSHHHLFSRTGP